MIIANKHYPIKLAVRILKYSHVSMPIKAISSVNTVSLAEIKVGVQFIIGFPFYDRHFCLHCTIENQFTGEKVKMPLCV